MSLCSMRMYLYVLVMDENVILAEREGIYFNRSLLIGSWF